MELIERQYLAHFIDSNFNSDPAHLGAGDTISWYRIGEDLEAFATELNPQVEIRKNILGAQKVIHNGYETQAAADTFYCYRGDALYTQLELIANERRKGDDCRTSRVDALFHLDASNELVCDWAYREDCWVVPNSIGGDTSGYQIPFSVYDAGNRVSGTMTKSGDAWTFTAT